MQSERMKNSIYNGLSEVLCNVFVAILSFAVRTVFIHSLGDQCLGLDGLFTNILSMLSLAELGFTSAISFSLYEPLAKKDNVKLGNLMSYFRKVYKNIAVIIFLGGLILLPFLNYFVKDYSVNYNIYLIFFLYLINSASSYLTSYNEMLLISDQKSYKLTWIKMAYNILVYSLQIVILVYTSNFILYLIVQFILRFLQRITNYIYINKMYSEIDFHSRATLGKEEKDKIKKNIKGLIFHRVGNYAVNGTDNILISALVNISTTGLYSNYLSIISIFKNLIGSVINATTSSFGNLNVLESAKTKENSFNVVNFICCSLSSYFVVCLFFCINPFINLWVGEKFLLGFSYIVIICINCYLGCLMFSVDAVKNSAGLFYIDRYVPIIQACINLFISIVLGIKIGLLGILLGTLISSVLTVNLIKPIVIYKNIFKSSYLNYFKTIFKNIIFALLITLICWTILNKISFSNNLLELIIRGLIVTFVYILTFILFYFNSKEFKYLKGILVHKK